jgi:hypothetical protein
MKAKGYYLSRTSTVIVDMVSPQLIKRRDTFLSVYIEQATEKPPCCDNRGGQLSIQKHSKYLLIIALRIVEINISDNKSPREIDR